MNAYPEAARVGTTPRLERRLCRRNDSWGEASEGGRSPPSEFPRSSRTSFSSDTPLVSCPRSLWTKRRAGRGAPPRNTPSRNRHRALVRSHESEATASGNAQKPRVRGGAPRPAPRRESTDFWDTTLAATRLGQE